MKNLILILILCIFLFSCFEKEEEVTVTEENPIENPADTTANDTTDVVVTPVDSVDMMQCEDVKQVMNYILSNPPREPRANAIKYIYNNEFVLFLYPGGNPEYGSSGVTNSDCEIVCEFGSSGTYPCADFYEKATLVDTVWVDRR